MKSSNLESRNFYIQQERVYLSFTTLPTFSYTQYDGLYFVFIQQELEMQHPKGRGKQSSSVQPVQVARSGWAILGNPEAFWGNPEAFWVGGCTVDGAVAAGREKTGRMLSLGNECCC